MVLLSSEFAVLAKIVMQNNIFSLPFIFLLGRYHIMIDDMSFSKLLPSEAQRSALPP
jgi:hypothetical protein